MAVEVSLTWVGRDAADFARVYRVAANIRSFKPVLKEIGEKVVAPSIAENFKAGGRPKWAPLADSTKRKKASRGQSSRILVATGAMERTAKSPSRYKVSRNALSAAPGPRYWKHHQTGTPQMPQRVIMMLQAQDRTAINRKFADYFRSFMTFDPGKPGARQFLGS